MTEDRPSSHASTHEPPIHRAARLGDLRALKALVENGADVNERTDLVVRQDDREADELFPREETALLGYTPLMAAARSRDGASVETLAWLIEHGADVRARLNNMWGWTAASFAAGASERWTDDRPVHTPDLAAKLRLLLDHGVDPNETDMRGGTLLTCACSAGDPLRVRLLLERRASIEPTAKAKAFWAHQMARCGNGTEPCSLASSGGPIDGVPEHLIPLFCAAESGCAECVGLLLDAGAEPDTRDSRGSTPLMSAGSVEAARALLEAGADLHATDEYGFDALCEHLRSVRFSVQDQSDHLAIARTLIEAGIDISLPNARGCRPLYDAAFDSNPIAVEFLLSLGARADEARTDGQTPLHAVCWNYGPAEEPRHEKVIRMLCDAGADVHAAGDGGWRPMHEAAEGDSPNPTAVRVLLELGADADPAATNGITPLMLAADRGSAECVQILLEAGADPLRCAGPDDWTAIDLAKRHRESWQYLVSHAATHESDQHPVYGTREEQLASYHAALEQARESLDLLEAAAQQRRREGGS